MSFFNRKSASTGGSKYVHILPSSSIPSSLCLSSYSSIQFIILYLSLKCQFEVGQFIKTVHVHKKKCLKMRNMIVYRLKRKRLKAQRLMTVAHYVLLYCYMSVFPIHYSYLTFPPTAFPLSSFLFPPNPLFPSHLQSPAIFQHSSGPPHRVPLCQWVREGAHSPTSHHVLPLDSP